MMRMPRRDESRGGADLPLSAKQEMKRELWRLEMGRWRGAKSYLESHWAIQPVGKAGTWASFGPASGDEGFCMSAMAAVRDEIVVDGR